MTAHQNLDDIRKIFHQLVIWGKEKQDLKGQDKKILNFKNFNEDQDINISFYGHFTKKKKIFIEA